MHASEFFYFSRTKYRQKTTDRSTDELHVNESLKHAKMAINKKAIPLEILLTLLSHGMCIWLLLISWRSIDVSKWKIEIIRDELRKRFLEEHGEIIRGVESETGRPFSDAQVDLMERLLRDTPTSGGASRNANANVAGRREEAVEERVEEREDRIENPPPPPYSDVTRRKSDASDRADVPAPAYS